MANTVQNVAVGKPAVNGALSVASTSATLPTSATATLTGFTTLGYISDDGAVNGFDADTVEIKAWGGDTVYSGNNGKTITWQTKLIEVLNVDVLKTVFGASNVSGTLAGGITVAIGNEEPDEQAVVIDTILRGALKRVVLPRAKVTEVADITYKDDEVVGYEVTFTAFPDSTGKSQYEYIVAES